MAYRIYVTDSLKLQGEDRYLIKRYADIINPQSPKEEKTGDEIAVDIITRHGLVVK